jgi:DNA-binding MarR family transcriptional regulator
MIAVLLGFPTIRKKMMPRRLKLSPLQRDIMWMLREAGGETTGTVIATIKPLDQIEFDQAVDGLIKLGLVRMESSTVQPSKAELVLTESGMEALRK